MNIPNKDALKTQICNATNCDNTVANQICTAIENHAGGNLGSGKWLNHFCNNGNGKKQVYHVSGGKIGANGATVFFIEDPAGTCYVVAIGSHKDAKKSSSDKYKIIAAAACWTHGADVTL